MKIISYSLFGDRMCYVDGAIWAATEAPRYYPGWTVRFYIDERMTKAIEWLSRRPCELVKMPPAEKMVGKSWRLLAAADPHAERIVFRDVDACLCAREADAVAEWEESGLDAHAMHDHPAHAKLLMPGMFGVRGGVLPNISDLIAQRIAAGRGWTAYGEDDAFACEVLAPRLTHSMMRHSSVPLPAKWNARPFRLERQTMIGEQFFRY